MEKLFSAKSYLRTFYCFFAFLSLALSIHPYGTVPGLVENGFLWLFLPVFLWYFFKENHGPADSGINTVFWILSILFSFLCMMGLSFSVFGSGSFFSQQPIRAFLTVFGRIFLFRQLMIYLYNGLTLNQPAALPADLHNGFVLAGLLMICWLPWFFWMWPGTVSWDSWMQIMQITGKMPYWNDNPIMQTLFLGLFIKFGLLFHSFAVGIFLYCLTEALLSALLFGFVLKELLCANAPAWLVTAAFCFYSFHPACPSYCFSVGKDTFFGLALLLLCLCLYRILRLAPEKAPSAGSAAGLLAALVLCALARNAGIFLSLVCIAVLLLWALIRRRKLLPLCLAGLCAVLCAYGLLHLVVMPGLHIGEEPQAANYSVPLQQVARMYSEELLDAGELETAGKVFNFKELHYNPVLSDPAKSQWIETASAEDQQAFWQLYFQLLARHPFTALSASFHNSYGYFVPGYLSPHPLLPLIDARPDSLMDYLNVSTSPIAETIHSVLIKFMENPLLRMLLAPGLFGCFTLFACAVLMAGPHKKYFLCALPALFYFAGLLMTPINGSVRYALPLYFCWPLLFMLVHQAAQKDCF